MPIPESDWADVRERLEAAQDALQAALRSGSTELLADLLTERRPDIEALAALARRDETIRAWARDYLHEDRHLMHRAMSARDQIGQRLAGLHKNLSAHRRYMSGGHRD